MKGKRLLILGAAFALGLSACANSATMVRKTPLKASPTAGTYSFTISKDDFNATSYAANNNEKTSTATCTTDNSVTMDVKWTSNQVMLNSDAMQWQKNKGYIYNSTNLGLINSVTVNSTAGSFTTYYGTGAQPSSGTTVGGGFFKVVVGSETGKTNNIVVNFTISGGPTQLATPNPQYDKDNNRVTWDAVPNAIGYQVSVGNESNFVNATSPYDGNFEPGNGYTVYVKAIGDGDNYINSATANVSFTAVAPFVGTDYVLCTSTADLVIGASYIITSGTEGAVKTMSSEVNTNNRKIVDVDVVDSKITTNSSTLTFTLGGNSGSWTFHTDNYLGTNGYFASGTGSDNHLKILENGNDHCSIAFSDDEAVITFSTNQNGRNIVRYNSGSSCFSCYASGQQPIYLWKDADAGTAPVFGTLDHIKVTTQPTKTSFFIGETFSAVGLILTGYDNVNEADAVTETYTSGYTTDYDGKTFASNDVGNNKTVTVTYSGKTATYVINVLAPIEKTVEEALEIANALESGNTTSEVYIIEGYITSIITAWNAEYGNVSYYLGDTSDAETVIEVYRSKVETGTTGEALKPGDKVSVSGHLTKYNTTPEFAAGCVTSLVEAAPLDKITVARAIEIANALENGVKSDKEYEIEGYIITVEYTWTSNNGITYLLGDTADSSTTIKVFKSIVEGGQTVGEDLKQGDKVKVAGYLTKYNDAPEVAQGCVTSLLETSSDPSSYLSAFSSFAKLNGTENNNVGQQTTVSETINELATANSWTISSGSNVVCYPSFNLDSVITVSTSGDANCGSVWSTNGVNDWRLYQAKNGDVTLSAKEGYRLVSAKFTFNVANTGSLLLNGQAVASEEDIALSSSSATFVVGNSGTAGNGQIKITAIEVTYEEFEFVSVDSVNIKFGASISKTNWGAIAAKFTISDYGIMLFKTNNPSNYSMTSVKDFYNNNESLSVIRKGSGDAPTLEGEDYVFFAKVNVKNVANYGVTFCAAPFIVIDDTYYFLEEKHYSVNTLAQYHLSTGGSELSTAALNVLAGN